VTADQPTRALRSQRWAGVFGALLWVVEDLLAGVGGGGVRDQFVVLSVR
jgi:hypothetical protein